MTLPLVINYCLILAYARKHIEKRYNGYMRRYAPYVLLALFIIAVLLYGFYRGPSVSSILSFTLPPGSSPSEAQVAAVLRTVPLNDTFTVGDAITVALVVDTKGVSINAVGGNITYSSDNVEIIDISTTDSIINYWVQEPRFSNASGTASFSGVVLSPGFTGSAGNIITLSFKAKRAGKTSIDITDAQVLANDGLGTNILTDVVPGTLVVKDKQTQRMDINGNGKVDLSDASILISYWGTSDAKSDLNGDGIVNLKDLSILAAKFVK